MDNYEKLYNTMKQHIDAENEDIHAGYGVRWLFCEDRTFEDWEEDVVEKIDIGDSSFEAYCNNATVEQLNILESEMSNFLVKLFHWENIDKKIEEREEANRRDAKIQAMEMGYNNYAGGVYWREW